MADLDKLRPEVRAAVTGLAYNEWMLIDAGSQHCLGIIRAELLRLAKIEEERWAVVATRNGALERAEKAEAELAESRETIKRLNRRVQVAEAGVAEKVKASGGSLGRALANAAASKAEAELAALKALLRECEPIISAYAESLHLTDGFRRRPHECDGLAEQVRALVKVEE